MVATMRRGLLLVLMVLALLAGLIGWTMKMQEVLPLHHSGISASQAQIIALHKPVCPPPPFDCH